MIRVFSASVDLVVPTAIGFLDKFGGNYPVHHVNVKRFVHRVNVNTIAITAAYIRGE
jgi:hypothetical protein